MTKAGTPGAPGNGRVGAGPRAHGELLSLVNRAGLVLDGLVFSPPRARLAIVHVHGSLGNFYQQPFIRVFANHLMQHRIALLSFNLTAHDGISEGYNPVGEMRYVGGSLSVFETCLDDLDALVGLARSLCPQVVLQGHSLGCDRVLFYTKQREAHMPLILLSPCDSHRLQELWLDGETVPEQVARLRADSDGGREMQLVQSCEYGVSGPDGWTYNIPITKAALLSIIAGPPFQTLRVGGAAELVSRAPAFVYVGGDDAIRGAPLVELVGHVRRLVPAARVFRVEDGDHSLVGCEEAVAKAISAWAYDVGLLSGG